MILLSKKNLQDKKLDVHNTGQGDSKWIKILITGGCGWACLHPSILETQAEMVGSLGIRGHPKLHRELEDSLNYRILCLKETIKPSSLPRSTLLHKVLRTK